MSDSYSSGNQAFLRHLLLSMGSPYVRMRSFSPFLREELRRLEQPQAMQASLRLSSMIPPPSTPKEPPSIQMQTKVEDTVNRTLNQALAFECEKLIENARDADTILKIVKSELEQVEARGQDMSIVNMATAFQRLAKLTKADRVQREKVLADTRFTLLVESIGEVDAEKLRPQTVAMLFWTCAVLDQLPFQIVVPLFTALARHLENNTLEAQHLTQVVWACGKLKKRPSKLLPLFQDRALELLGDMSTQNCVNLLWGFAKLNVKPLRLLPRLAHRLVSHSMLDNALPVEISDLSFALVHTTNSSREADVLLLDIAKRASVNIEAYRSNQLVNVVNVFTRLEATKLLDDGQLETWLNRIVELTRERPLRQDDENVLKSCLRDLKKADLLDLFEWRPEWNNWPPPLDPSPQPESDPSLDA